MTVIAIIGSRNFPDPEIFIDYTLDGLGEGDGLVSGGARGVDTKAEQFAVQRGMTVVSLRPQKVRGGFFVEHLINGRTAGLMGDPAKRFETFAEAAFWRNWLIAREAVDGVTAIWTGDSTGTAHGIACAVRQKRNVTIWMPGDTP